MLSRLVYFLTGVYSGVVAEQIYKRHKGLETWGPKQAWERSKARFEERLRLWRSGQRTPGFWSKSFTSDTDIADEDASAFTETLRSEEGYTSAGGPGLEEQVRAMKGSLPEVKEIFEEKLKMWEVNAPEVKGLMEEKMNMLKERAPVVQGVIEEGVRVLKEAAPDIKERVHDKVKGWKDKGHGVKDVLRTAKERAAAGGEVMTEGLKVFKGTSPGVKDVVEGEVKAAEETEVDGGDFEVLKEKVAEVVRELEESGSVLSDRIPELREVEGPGADLTASSSEFKDILETKRGVLRDKPLEMKDMLKGKDVFVGRYRKFKEALKEKGVFTEKEAVFKEKEDIVTEKEDVSTEKADAVKDNSSEFKNILEGKEKVVGGQNFENNEMFIEREKRMQDSFVQMKENEDKKDTSTESPPELKEKDEKDQEFQEKTQECPELSRESVEVLGEIPLAAQRKLDDATSHIEEQPPAESHEVIMGSAHDVKKILREKVTTFKRSAPDVTEILKGKMNSLKENAPEVTELLKGKLNALKRKFRGDSSAHDQKRGPCAESKDEPKDEVKDEPNNEPAGDPKITPGDI